MPVRAAALVIMVAMEWLYPASTGALGVLRLRIHSIQLRTWLLVSLSPPVLALAITASVIDKVCSGKRLGCIPISSVNFLVKPPFGDTVLVMRFNSPPLE